MDWTLVWPAVAAAAAVIGAGWSIFQIRERTGASTRYERWRRVREDLQPWSPAWQAAHSAERDSLVDMFAGLRGQWPARAVLGAINGAGLVLASSVMLAATLIRPIPIVDGVERPDLGRV